MFINKIDKYKYYVQIGGGVMGQRNKNKIELWGL